MGSGPRGSGRRGGADDLLEFPFVADDVLPCSTFIRTKIVLL